MNSTRADSVLTEEELATCPVEDRFRLRGTETTRLDTLIDAAFAFTLTLLVISHEGVPKSYDELVSGLLYLPALTVSFAVLMMFWFGHRRWSRRYGLENPFTVAVSLALVFVLMIYVYPLRMIFEGMFAFLTGGLLPFPMSFTTEIQARTFFAFYAAGFLAMSSLMTALYHSSLKNADLLRLDAYERFETVYQRRRWLVSVVFSVLSILIALFIPITFVPLSGFIFFGIFIHHFVYARITQKQRTAL